MLPMTWRFGPEASETRVSDVQRWWEYEYGYEWRFYESDDDRPTDSERLPINSFKTS